MADLKPTKVPAFTYAEIDGPKHAAYQQGAEYWGPPDVERYEHYGLDEAIEYQLDDCRVRSMPDKIEIVGMRPMALSIEPGHVLDPLLEALAEDYSDPDGSLPDQTVEMIAAAQALATIIENQFHVWRCELAVTVTVDTRAWMAERRPDWLDAEVARGAAP